MPSRLSPFLILFPQITLPCVIVFVLLFSIIAIQRQSLLLFTRNNIITLPRFMLLLHIHTYAPHTPESWMHTMLQPRQWCISKTSSLSRPRPSGAQARQREQGAEPACCLLIALALLLHYSPFFSLFLILAFVILSLSPPFLPITVLFIIF